MAPLLSPDDEGKPVIDTNGEQLGTVLEVTDEEVLIAPSPHACEHPRAIVERSDGNEHTGVPPDHIETITEDTVRIDL